jgi:hypothetical protein
MHLPDGRKTKAGTSFKEVLLLAAFQGIGNEIVFADYRPHFRLVLIENPLQG